MSELAKSPYLEHVRELKSRVYMGFYQNTGEDIGDAHINRNGWNWVNHEVTAPESDPFHNKAKQILTFGLATKKYCTLDGKSRLDGTVSLADSSPNCIIGLWSDVLSDASTGLFVGKKPTYSIWYNQLRNLSEMNVIGNSAWGQFPVDYDIVVYKATANNLFMRSALPRIVAEVSQTISVEGIQEADKVTFQIRAARAIDQTIRFTDGNGQQITLPTQNISLVISKWSEPGAASKIMFFSRDRSITCEEEDIKSITVYEEKTASVDELTFGVSSNSCTVEVSNVSKVFDSNPDFLKKGKLLTPSIGLKGREGFRRLGKFYSDTWDRSSNSQFITCKGYDILYGLQSVTLNIPFEGSLSEGYHSKRFSSVYEAFKAVLDGVNEEKHRNEIYGADIEYVLDEYLKTIPFPNAFFEEKSAWDTLQELGNYSLSHVYTDREGYVRVSCDIGQSVGKTLREDLYIDPSNSFNYSLPVQSRTIVNKISVPYRYTAEGKAEDNTISIDKEKIITQNGVMTFSVDLTNYYPDGFKFELQKKVGDDTPEIITDKIKENETRVYYNKIYFTVSAGFAYDSLILKIIPNSDLFNAIKEATFSYQAADGLLSIKKNGVCLLDFPSTPFTDANAAKRIAESVIGKYNDGVEYVEAEWIGSPELAIGEVILCSSMQDKTKKTFESYSNEFTLNGGLRVKSKLRKV